MSAFDRANAAFVAEDYDAAAELYNDAVRERPNDPACFLNRASNLVKLTPPKLNGWNVT